MKNRKKTAYIVIKIIRFWFISESKMIKTIWLWNTFSIRVFIHTSFFGLHKIFSLNIKRWLFDKLNNILDNVKTKIAINLQLILCIKKIRAVHGTLLWWHYLSVQYIACTLPLKRQPPNCGFPSPGLIRHTIKYDCVHIMLPM